MPAWRRRGDSNPRDPFGPNGFQDRRFQPLTHPSASEFNWQWVAVPNELVARINKRKQSGLQRKRIAGARGILIPKLMKLFMDEFPVVAAIPAPRQLLRWLFQ